MCWSVHTSELIRHHWSKVSISKQMVQSFTAADMLEQAMLLLSSSQHSITKTTFYGDHNLLFQISVFGRPNTAFQAFQHLIFQFQNSLHQFLFCFKCSAALNSSRIFMLPGFLVVTAGSESENHHHIFSNTVASTRILEML